MNTTVLIVEVLLIGFQVLIWISLSILNIFGYQWIDPSKLTGWAPLISLALIGVSYTFGIIFNSLVASAYLPWMKKLVSKWRQSYFAAYKRDDLSLINTRQMRFYVMMKSPDVSHYLRRQLHRTQLLRGTSVNFFIIGILTFVFVVKQVGFSLPLLISVILVSIISTFLAIFTWRRSFHKYIFELMESYYRLKVVETGISGTQNNAEKSSHNDKKRQKESE